MLNFHEPDVLIQALAWYRDIRSPHFADAYIATVAVARGHGTVISFDRGLQRVAGLKLARDPSAIP